MTSTSANDRQVGGDHYQKKEYQHWDWVCDINLHYLLACATKYVARWRDKNGIQDLEKATHYLDKAVEREVAACLPPSAPMNSGGWRATLRFTDQLPLLESRFMREAVSGEYDSARDTLAMLISVSEQETPKPESQG